MNLHDVHNDPNAPDFDTWGEVMETTDGTCRISVEGDPGAPGQSIEISPAEAASLGDWLTRRFSHTARSS